MILYYKMYITRVLIGRNPCLDQAIQTRKTIVLLLFYKTITLWFPCLDGTIQTLGNVARVKKSGQNHSPTARNMLTLATFPRVWIRPSKHGNHKVIVYYKIEIFTKFIASAGPVVQKAISANPGLT
jgi:hypothetical protein